MRNHFEYHCVNNKLYRETCGAIVSSSSNKKSRGPAFSHFYSCIKGIFHRIIAESEMGFLLSQFHVQYCKWPLYCCSV